MKKYIAGLVMAVSLFTACSYVASVQIASAQSITLQQLVQLFISLGIIAPDKMSLAEAIAGLTNMSTEASATTTQTNLPEPSITLIGTPSISSSQSPLINGNSTTTITATYNLSIQAVGDSFSFKNASAEPFDFFIYENGMVANGLSIPENPSWESFSVPTSGVITQGLPVGIAFELPENNTITLPVTISFIPTGPATVNYSVALIGAESMASAATTGQPRYTAFRQYGNVWQTPIISATGVQSPITVSNPTTSPTTGTTAYHGTNYTAGGVCPQQLTNLLISAGIIPQNLAATAIGSAIANQSLVISGLVSDYVSLGYISQNLVPQANAIVANATAGSPYQACLSSFTPNAPGITSLTPSSGPAGTAVTITGINLGTNNTVLISGITSINTSSDGSTVEFTVPQNTPAGSYFVDVTNNSSNDSSNNLVFRVTGSQTTTQTPVSPTTNSQATTCTGTSSMSPLAVTNLLICTGVIPSSMSAAAQAAISNNPSIPLSQLVSFLSSLGIISPDYIQAANAVITSVTGVSSGNTVTTTQASVPTSSTVNTQSSLQATSAPVCGGAQGVSSTVQPTTNLCSIGSASDQRVGPNSVNWLWDCTTGNSNNVNNIMGCWAPISQ